MSYKWWIFVAVFLFSAGLIFGLAAPNTIRHLFSADITALRELGEVLASYPRPAFLVLILAKNVSAILISLVLSPVLCLAPVAALAANGCLVGLVSIEVVKAHSLGYLLTGLLPHGIFELPAVIMGEAVALWLGSTVMLSPFTGGGKKRLISNLKRSLKYLGVALALLVPAAIMETYVTPLLLK